MKQIISFIALLFSFITVQAQWSVELDMRYAPANDIRQNIGTDILVNYKVNLGRFFVQPSVGLFYERYTNSSYEINGGTFPSNKGYRTGIDISAVGGMQFDLGLGKFGVFTGPRYGYAFAQKKECDHRFFYDYLPNSFDWRFGISYSFWRLTASAKVDIACLNFKKSSSHSSEKQPTTLAIGVAYNF